MPLTKDFVVNSPNVTYGEKYIESQYVYDRVAMKATADRSGYVATPMKTEYTFRTERTVPRTGMMLVGLGGNNGSTLAASLIAHKEGITWRTKDGIHKPDFFGSLTQASTVRLGADENGEDIFVLMKDLVPMVNPTDLVVGGWDINGCNLAECMERSKVLDYDLQRQLEPYMKEITPLPSVYFPDFIAANQGSRANNVLTGSHMEQLEQIRKDIREFKEKNNLDKVVVLWTANTERFSDIVTGVNDTKDNLMTAIKNNDPEISPSTLFSVACILENTPYINGSPQNTFVPGVIELAEEKKVNIAGDDFKTGQTKMKSVLMDFLVSSGIKPVSIVSYNHLGNNDGKNLSAPSQFRSKEISKSNVVDDMVASNELLYPKGEHPDHCVVIKYVPAVADSKRAMDEYCSKIFMNGTSTIAIHNTCEDSLLAAPLMLDLVLVLEMTDRIKYKTADMENFECFHPVQSLLSFMIKAPLVPQNTPVVNALAKQRACIENIFKACVGLPVENNMLLEYKAFAPKSADSAAARPVTA